MRNPRSRSFLFAALLSGAAAIAGFATAGPPGQWYTTTYYADATRSGDPVGGNIANCGGQFSSWGTTTAYYTRVFGQCPR